MSPLFGDLAGVVAITAAFCAVAAAFYFLGREVGTLDTADSFDAGVKWGRYVERLDIESHDLNVPVEQLVQRDAAAASTSTKGCALAHPHTPTFRCPGANS